MSWNYLRSKGLSSIACFDELFKRTSADLNIAEMLLTLGSQRNFLFLLSQQFIVTKNISLSLKRTNIHDDSSRLKHKFKTNCSYQHAQVNMWKVNSFNWTNFHERMWRHFGTCIYFLRVDVFLLLTKGATCPWFCNIFLVETNHFILVNKRKYIYRFSRFLRRARTR